MKNKKLLLILSTVMVIAIFIVSSTLAFLQWASTNEQQTNVTIAPSAGFSCSVDGGGNITSNDIQLVPTSCMNSNYAIKRTITTNVVNTRGVDVNLELSLRVNSISSSLSSSSNFKYAITDNSNSCVAYNTYASGGDFSDVTSGNQINLVSDDIYSTSESKTYYLYIWLDYDGEDNVSQDQSFDFSLEGNCTDRPVISPNPPEVVDGLIPVVLSDTGDTVVTVAENDSAWYNYTQKKWANAVLVNENTHTRSYYLSNPHTEIPLNDILAYYVWIPRYSYEVWQYTGLSNIGQERQINIEFANVSTKKQANGPGEWYTHPAFTFGDQELSGIWVGKFETSHATLINAYNSNNLQCSYSSCTTYNGLRILPNVSSYYSSNVSNLFYVSRAMEKSGNSFGINPSTADTHMMKDSEWGAVAYLSHSKYGINRNIRKNNASTKMTGCGALIPDASNTSNCDNSYLSVSKYPQSTTGNVTGIFDMNGGDDYVMGTWNNDNNYGNESNSGFNSSTNPLPNSKYYDNYPSSIFNASNTNNFSRCTFQYCGGHALSETYKWYYPSDFFVYSSGPWFSRGSYGIFNASGMNGNASLGREFRLVLVAE